MSIRVTMTDIDTGDVVSEHTMNSNSTFVLVTGPNYYLDGENHYANGTIQLTIRRHQDGEDEDGD